MALYPTRIKGKSPTSITNVNGFVPIHRWVHLRQVAENATFVLPANVELTGKWVVANPSDTQQAAVTIGTAAAGTQISAGAAVAAGISSGVVQGTRLAPSNADRTIYVESAAWQAGVSVLVEAIELPVVSNPSGIY